MYLLLSPAKNLNEKTTPPIALTTSTPPLLTQSAKLIARLKQLDAIDLQELMSISAKIAEQNALRNQAWHYPYADNPHAKACLYLFDGDAYKGLNAYSLTQTQVSYLNTHLGILSGLYGILKPLDAILPYRLEMGTKLTVDNHDTLYQFWGDTITNIVNERLAQSGSDVLVNLASTEYFGVIEPSAVHGQIITPRFEDCKNGTYKVISFYAKRARGLMARFAAVNAITDVNDLKAFDSEGYYFDKSVSDATTWVFRRDDS